MVHKSGRRWWAIAASFAGQAAIIAVVATGSARGGSTATSAAPAPLPAAPAPTAPIIAPPSVPAPAVPLPPGEIPVTMTVTGVAGDTARTGDISFPMPEDPPRFVVKAGGAGVMTVDLTIPAGAKVGGLWLSLAADRRAGVLPVQVRLLSVGQPLSPGHHVYTLHQTALARAAPGNENLLVLGVQHLDGPTDEAPIAELVTG
jgi:hypothetical protein